MDEPIFIARGQEQDNKDRSPLIPCLACGKVVSRRAVFCPNCGDPRPVGSSKAGMLGEVDIGVWTGMKIGFGFFLVALILAAAPFLLIASVV